MTMAHVESSSDVHDRIAEAIIDNRSNVIVNWHQWIAGTIAQSFRCRVMYRPVRGTGGRELMIFGLAEDVTVCTAPKGQDEISDGSTKYLPPVFPTLPTPRALPTRVNGTPLRECDIPVRDETVRCYRTGNTVLLRHEAR